MKKIVLLVSLLSGFSCLHADNQADSPNMSPGAEVKKLRLLNVRAEASSVFQTSGYSITGGVMFAPAYWLNEKMGLVLLAGAAFPRGATRIFIAIEYQLLFTYQMDKLNFELGGGGQTWLDTTTQTMPMASANVAWTFPNKILGMLDRIYAGYSMLFTTTPSLGHEARLGVQASF